MKNKSRIPFHSLDNSPTVIRIINDILEKHSSISVGTNQNEWMLYYVLIDILVAAYHVSTAKPKRVLELGCANGVLSYHLASLLGKFHPDSLLYGISNVIGNESGNLWIDRICRVQQQPKLAFAAVDYERTNLMDDHFDITIINGSIMMENEKQLIEEAKRVTKMDGRIICFAIDQPLLESAFRLLVPEVEEYSFVPRAKILVK